MTKEETHERVLLACVLLFEVAKRVIAKASEKEIFGATKTEIEQNLRSKIGLNLGLEKISEILNNGIEKGLYENRGGVFFLTDNGMAEAKDKRTKEAMRLVLLGQYTN